MEWLLGLVFLVGAFKFAWWGSKEPLWKQIASFGVVFVIVMFLIGAYQGSR